MKNWEKALNKFIRPYLTHKDVQGILLCGSYAGGYETPQSDIDVHIIYDDCINERERGNVQVDGFLIEYFKNPARKIKAIIEQESLSPEKCTIGMFAKGRLLYDKSGVVNQLMCLAREKMNQPADVVQPDVLAYKLYSLWNMCDEYKAAICDQRPVGLIYFSFLHKLVEVYFYKKGYPLPPVTKVDKIILDSSYCQKYYKRVDIESDFRHLFETCLTALPMDQTKAILALNDFVVKTCGGFNIDGFMLRSPV